MTALSNGKTSEQTQGVKQETQPIERTNSLSPTKNGTSVSLLSNPEEKLEEVSVTDSLRLIDDLKFFLATSPVNWHENQVIRRYFLNKEGFVSCVYWNDLYFITGTDIVRCVAYKVQHFGRQIIDRKKFEEGIFSDLRALKCGVDAVLEEPRSPFLKFLHKNQCLRTQKKQKVFFWFSVPHDKLFADALERDLKKEMASQPATTKAVREPSLSLKFNMNVALSDQIAAHLEKDGEFRKGDIYDVDDNNHNVEQIVDSQLSSGPQTIENDHPTTISASDADGDDFPLDYLQPMDPVMVDTGDYEYDPSIQGNYITYGLPSLYMDPSMYMASPGRVLFMGDYLLDQVTPVVPYMFSQQQHQQLISHSANQQHQTFQQQAATSRNLRMTPRSATSNPLMKRDTPSAGTFSQSIRPLSRTPSPTTLLISSNRAGNNNGPKSSKPISNEVKKDDESSEAIPQVLYGSINYQPYSTGFSSMIDGLDLDPYYISMQLKSQQMGPLSTTSHYPYGLFGPSPYHPDFPLLAASGAIQQTSSYIYNPLSAKEFPSANASAPPPFHENGNISNMKPSIHVTKGAMANDRLHSAIGGGGKITKNVNAKNAKGKPKLMNPFLQHLDLSTLYDDNEDSNDEVDVNPNEDAKESRPTGGKSSILEKKKQPCSNSLIKLRN